MSNIYDINTRQSKNKKVMSFYNKAMKELINFYGINWVNHTPEIYLVNTRKDFNLISGYETEDWVVGKALGYNKLLLFSPESYEKESRHKYSDEEYYSLLKHELSHLFYMIFSKGKGPVWLDEGFAIYTSNQLSTKERPKEFKNFLKYYSHEDEKVYSEAGFVVEGLIKEYGKEKVIGFLRVLPNINSEGVFKNEFKKYFGMELDYFNINNKIKKLWKY
ncbi:hypothetical protein KBH77_04210 [Patescibacteria group bacterium]|nr:hypothetical protein [Patescibacteria group bacterium]